MNDAIEKIMAETLRDVLLSDSIIICCDDKAAEERALFLAKIVKSAFKELMNN